MPGCDDSLSKEVLAPALTRVPSDLIYLANEVKTKTKTSM